MRVNLQTLRRIAHDTVSNRTRRDRGVLSVFLSGSLLEDEYLLGGTADIDLTFIHLTPVSEEREIVRLTDEIHLDIAHHPQREYRQPRELRLHPWRGPTIFHCEILYDPQHFMDFTQASVRGQFHRSDYVLDRARQQAVHARQIWFGYADNPPREPGPEEIGLYLRAIEHAANAVSSLEGPPLTERRFLLKFAARAEAVGRPGLYAGLLGLLGGPNTDAEGLKGLLGDWDQAYQSLPEESLPPRLHPSRRAYYMRAFQAMIDAGKPLNALWPMLRTWTRAAALQSEDSPARSGWMQACQQLKLVGDDFPRRLEALDAFLDMVEERLDDWGRSRGVEIYSQS
jgi:hypothetical protein